MTLAIFSVGHRPSTRCPDKMLRPFANTTLTDLVMAKLKTLGLTYPVFFAAHEEVFADKAGTWGVPFVRQSLEASLIGGPARAIHHYLEAVPYEWVCLLNASLPFLSVPTIRAFIAQATAHGEPTPAFAVVEQRDYFLTANGTPVNFDESLATINTKVVPPLHKFAHAIYLFHRRHFLNTGQYWDWKTVKYILLPDDLELFDIDETWQFEAAEAVWRARQAAIPLPAKAGSPLAV